jgi:recombination protein RecA
MTTDKEKALELTIDQIERHFGKGSIMKLGEAASAVEAIPSGSLALDLALGVNGVPRGRITEIFGPEASGKTTLGQHIIAEVQKLGGVAAYREQALEIAEALVRSGAIDAIVIDSVAALVPRAEIEGEMGDTHVGLQARLMSQALRKLAAIIGKTGTAVVFINQLREKVGVIFGNPEVTPGGRALKFYSSVRIDLRRSETIKQGNEAIGNRVRARVVKNKVAPPFKTAEFDIMFAHGISREGDLIDLGVALGVVKKTGAFFSYGDIRLGQGRENAKQYLSEHPELGQEIEQQIKASAVTNYYPVASE